MLVIFLEKPHFFKNKIKNQQLIAISNGSGYYSTSFTVFRINLRHLRLTWFFIDGGRPPKAAGFQTFFRDRFTESHFPRKDCYKQLKEQLLSFIRFPTRYTIFYIVPNFLAWKKKKKNQSVLFEKGVKRLPTFHGLLWLL